VLSDSRHPDFARFVPGENTGSGGLGDAYVRPVGLYEQKNGLVVQTFAPDERKVFAVELFGALDSGVDHRSVETRKHLETAAPVLRNNGRFQAGEVHPSHMNEAPLNQRGLSPLDVLECDRP